MTSSCKAWGGALALVAIAGFVIGCQKKAEPKPVVLPGDDVVLADIGDTKITRYDVDLATRSMLTDKTIQGLDDAGRRKVLESLVQSRVIAHKREAEMTAEQRLELEKKVAAYREEELVRQYLGVHARVQPVTHDMVVKYYNDHPERHGASASRQYELIMSTRELADAERQAWLEALADPGARADWPKWVAELQKKKLPIVYQRSEGQESALHPSLRASLLRLKVGQSSALTFVQGRAYVGRALEETRTPPKALAEVSDEIRESLAPVQLKKAVMQATELAMKDAKVTYR